MQIVAQRHTPPAEAALLMSFESVFAAISGAVPLGEQVTALGVVGCALIVSGGITVEAAPGARATDAARAQDQRGAALVTIRTSVSFALDRTRHFHYVLCFVDGGGAEIRASSAGLALALGRSSGPAKRDSIRGSCN